MKYKHIVLARHGGSEVLQFVEDELPEPESGEVRVKILATSVAYTDVLVREGLYPGIPKPPFSPGYELVGVVDKLGTGITDLHAGQRVAALTVVGSYSEYLCLPATELVPVPETVDPQEAVCLILQYVTAYQLLHRLAQVKSGDRLLVHGATGGVGTALLQLGKLAALEMYGTAPTTQQSLVAQLGAVPIDYQREDFVTRIQALTQNGMDVVLDAIGGLHLIRSYKILCNGGRLINYGFRSAMNSKQGRLLKLGFNFVVLTLLQWLRSDRHVRFYSITQLKQQHPDWFREDLITLFDLLHTGKIKPIICDRLPLAEAAKAHRLLETSTVGGQYVLICNE
ncbi:zinc-binding dehydrogenase [Oscillatoria sp. FACHB-1407]|uniref:medium chain dehydrogenase/reductase family protein n=1 Tax=Oscillatoria sp. FACHB-1407 TaxID=2692847 RepID=UPI0016851423|nr:medium chain dehydrogenase/reductase family protein [Oscillatoria sp. FACHB-1407]MBD2461139.1 zinc-binding dehydrogenase [Oscillatoria sp. FACHB-1407]